MKVVVPKAVDVTAILRNQGLREKKINELKPKVYFLLSKIVTHPLNYKMYEETNGYRTVCFREMMPILGRRHFDQILNLLKDGPDKVIESNGKYMNGKFCYGYRLTEKYRTGEIAFKIISDEFFDNHEKLPVDLPDYSYLDIMFIKHNLEIDENVSELLQKLALELFKGIKNGYQEKLVINFIGIQLLEIELYKSKSFHQKTSNSNFRYNSIFTKTPRFLRGNIRCNGYELIEIDIKASQPYMLAALINAIINKLNFDLYNNICGDIRPLIARVFEQGKIKDFQLTMMNFQFDNDFYSSIVERFSFEVDRAKVKRYVMLFLFDDNLVHRNTNKYLIEIRRILNGLDILVSLIHKELGTKKFARSLQKLESKLLLDIVVREFHLDNPNCPIFAIHDAIYTTLEYSERLHSWIGKRFFEITGIKPGLGLKPIKYSEELCLDKAKEKLKEWAKVKSEKDYEKFSHSVFPSSYELGEEFVKNMKVPRIRSTKIKRTKNGM